MFEIEDMRRKPHTPPTLHFVGQRPSEEERIRLISSLAEKMRLPHRESAVSLFLFYCDMDEGFAPSEGFITKSLAMSDKSYLRGRTALSDAGLINWDRERNEIEINFHILWVIDTLEPGKAGLWKSSSGICYPKLREEKDSRTIGERNRHIPGYSDLSHLNENERHFFKAIDRMTPEEECEVFELPYDEDLEENWVDYKLGSVNLEKTKRKSKSVSTDWIDNLRPVKMNPSCDLKKYVDECRNREGYVADPSYSWNTREYAVCFNGEWTRFDANGMRIQ